MNVPKFKAKLVEKEISRTELASLWGCTTRTVTNKITGKSPVSLDEAKAFSKRAELTDEEKFVIFLAE